jgi:putative holliday junction resolvase
VRVLGLDLGSRTCGIALSDPSGTIATGLDTLRFEDGKYEIPLDYVARIVDNKNVDLIVLGHPKNMDGSIGFQGRLIEDFKMKLELKVACKIVLWDERLTSKMAESVLLEADYSRKQRKFTVDKIAATVILQSYLDSRR